MNRNLIIAAVVVVAIGFGAFFFDEHVAQTSSVEDLLSKTYANSIFGFSLRMPADYSAYPPDADATASTSGEAIVLQNAGGDAVQIEITPSPYQHPDNTLTLSDLSQLEPSLTSIDASPIAITPGVTGMTYTDPNGAFGASTDVLFFYHNNLYEITTSADLFPLLQAMLSTWNFSS